MHCQGRAAVMSLPAQSQCRQYVPAVPWPIAFRLPLSLRCDSKPLLACQCELWPHSISKGVLLQSCVQKHQNGRSLAVASQLWIVWCADVRELSFWGVTCGASSAVQCKNLVALSAALTWEHVVLQLWKFSTHGCPVAQLRHCINKVPLVPG